MEDFIHIVKSPAHWAFELLLMVLIDGIILGIVWPWIKDIQDHINKHK